MIRIHQLFLSSFSIGMMMLTSPLSAAVDLSDSGSGLSIKADPSRPCQACGFAVTVSSGQTKRVLEITSTIRALSAARIIAPTSGLLVGKYDDYASWITIFDLRDGHTIANAPAYWPSLSPDNRYLVFVRFYPEHFVDARASSNVVAFYDLHRPIPAAQLHANVLLGNVAYPIPPDGLYHSVQNGFTWHGSDDFTFEDLIQGFTYAVNVSLNGDFANATKMRTSKAHVDY